MQTRYPLPTMIETSTDAIRVVLQLAQAQEERKWVRQVWREEHYLHREIIGLARPVTYMAVLEQGAKWRETFVPEQRERVGLLTFSRGESTRCQDWYGNLADVASGWAPYSQWELLTLSRCWLAPCMQRRGKWHIPNLASLLMQVALQHIQVDYLLQYPPAHFDQPWKLRECVSYCESARFLCSLYWLAGFQFVHERQGKRAYRYVLPQLSTREEDWIRKASWLDSSARKKRQVQNIEHQVLLRFYSHRKVA